MAPSHEGPQRHLHVNRCPSIGSRYELLRADWLGALPTSYFHLQRVDDALHLGACCHPVVSSDWISLRRQFASKLEPAPCFVGVCVDKLHSARARSSPLRQFTMSRLAPVAVSYQNPSLGRLVVSSKIENLTQWMLSLRPERRPAAPSASCLAADDSPVSPTSCQIERSLQLPLQAA